MMLLPLLLLRGRPDGLAFATTRGSRQVPLSAPVGVHDVDVGVAVGLLTNAIFRPSGDQ